jgi:hypothetical protein
LVQSRRYYPFARATAPRRAIIEELKA